MLLKKFTHLLKPTNVAIVLLLCISLFINILLQRYNQKKLVSPLPEKLNYSGLHVEGNHFFDQTGKITILRGASRWSLEFSCGDGHFTASDFAAMKSWGMNTVRIPFNESYFLNETLCNNHYQPTLFKAVKAAKNAGLFVLLDLHWIRPNEVDNVDERGGQFPMPDNQALLVWKQLATKYKNDPKVLFEFMNEPHDVSCDVWKNGGVVNSIAKTGWIQQVTGTYITPGFQKFVDMTRQLGADNIIIQGASGEADLTCVEKMPLTDPKNNIAYQAHFYGTNPDGDWQKTSKNITDLVPIIAGEYNSQQAFTVPHLFENKLKTGYLFWAWDAGDTISDYSGTPKNSIWQRVHDFMKSKNTTPRLHN